MKIYLDDIRTPIDNSWIVVRNMDEFISTIKATKLEQIEQISFDHDLGFYAMQQWHVNVTSFKDINYEIIHHHGEYTGKDCAQWLINHFYDVYGEAVFYPRPKFKFPKCTVHSANIVGRYNIIGVIMNFYYMERQTYFNVEIVDIPHTVNGGF